MKSQLQFTLGSFHAHFTIGHLSLHSGRQHDRLFTDSRHNPLLLPDRAKELATQALGPRLPVAHDAFAGAEDGNPKSIENGRELIAAAIKAQSRPAGTIDLANDPLTLRSIFQVDPEKGFGANGIRVRLKSRMPGFVGAHLADLIVENKTLILEHLNDPLLHARGRNIHGRPLNAIRIANLRQQISYRIGHHVASLPLTNSL